MPERFLGVTPERSELMARVRAKDSKPEMLVRRAAHTLGYRFRLHRRGLPGTPDLVFPRLRKVIFVHGCFWHRHRGCSRSTTPKTRTKYWSNKFAENKARDAAQLRELKKLGWGTIVIWECQTRDLEALLQRLQRLLSKLPGD